MSSLTRRCFLTASIALASETRAEATEGVQVDYAWDGRDQGHPELAWRGRAFIPPSPSGEAPRALIVFLHGLNRALIPYRWMGGGEEGDLRSVVAELVRTGAIAPAVIAAPSSTVASQVSRGASWRRFDLDHFLALTKAAVAPHVTLDDDATVVAGHSGAGCSTTGGIATAAAGRTLRAVLSIDTCMAPALAQALARAPAETHIVVAYQTLGWGDRPFRAFERTFRNEVKSRPPAAGVLRELDHQKPERAYHDATVELTFARWLPRVLPPRAKSAQ